MKILQINPVVRTNTSTGKIMKEIGDLAMANGWESYIAYSRGRDGVPSATSKLVPVGNKLSVALHGLETRLFDRHGLGSRFATKRFIRDIKRIDPDVIHIHNIHGYFLNYKILFDYLAGCGKPVVWTVHDCWLYTGHCYYYSAAGCDRWKSGCGNCPQKKAFPSSLLVDRSARNFKDKSRAFNSVENLTIVPVSEWICSEMSHSFLSSKPFQVIHNGIDTDIFKPMNDKEVRQKYGLEDRHIILGLASIWVKEKGFDDMLHIARMVDPATETVVMVGKMTEDQLRQLPESVVRIARTDNQRELAALYSAATVFVNPTWQDNYPTVNLESIACGTPVVTYNTGGSPESIVEGETGYVVEQGDVEGMLARAREVEMTGKKHYAAACREYAIAHFRKEDRYREYLELYAKLSGPALPED